MYRGILEPRGVNAIRTRGDQAGARVPAGARQRVLSAGLFVSLRRRSIWRRGTDPAGQLRRHRGGQGCRKIRRRWPRNGDLRAPGCRRHVEGCEARRGVGRCAKPAAQQQLLPPGIELPRADAVLVRHHRRRHARLHALGYDPALLLRRPPTPLAAGGTVGVRTASAHMITRRSALCPHRPPRHPVVLRHGQHLAPNRPRREMWCRRPAYGAAASPGKAVIEKPLGWNRRFASTKRPSPDHAINLDRTGQRGARRRRASLLVPVGCKRKDHAATYRGP